MEALNAFVREQLQVSINEFTSREALNALMDRTKRNVIAYYKTRDGPEYQNFQKVAALLREDCSFWIGTDAALNEVSGNTLIYQDPSIDGEQKVDTRFILIPCTISV